MCFTLGTHLRWNQTGKVVAGGSFGSSPAQLRRPSCLYIDQNNTLYICDTGNNRIQKWIASDSSGSTVAGSSVGTAVAGTIGIKSSALTDLDHPSAVLVDDNLNIYILDKHNNRIVQWTPNATIGIVMITSSLLNDAEDFIFVPSTLNQVYISDPKNNVIYQWIFNAASPTLQLSQVNSSTSSLREPRGMTVDQYGNLYVTDLDNNRVVMYCDNSTVGIVVVGGTGSTPTLYSPIDVALDLDLNMYVVVENDNQVIKFSRQ
ncbi:hypothetical protein I4U23_015734 [Adineta vaga]|nr:hypothetical protein I4U23_015734 [Adineta vaga]